MKAPSILGTVMEKREIRPTDLVLVSVGITCQTAHQLARYADQHRDAHGGVAFRKGPFDWIAVPPAIGAAWLDAGFDAFGEGEIIGRDGRAWFDRRRVGYWHGFRRKPRPDDPPVADDDHGPGAGKVLDIPYAFERELSKFEYQRDVFRDFDPTRTLFVTGNGQHNAAGEIYRGEDEVLAHMDEAGFDALQGALDRFFGAPTMLAAVVHEERATPGLMTRENVRSVAHDVSAWQGDDADWDRALDPLVADARARMETVAQAA